MDEFKRKSTQKNCGFDKPDHYDDMWHSNPKKYGRKAARKKLKNNIPDIYSEHEWWSNDQLFNTWDIDEWDDHGRYVGLCNEIEEYENYEYWNVEVDNHQNMMDWTNDAIRF